VEFTPLVKKHIDVLIGEYLDVPTKPKISCKDSETISLFNRDKQLEISKKVCDFYKSKISNHLLSYIPSNEK